MLTTPDAPQRARWEVLWGEEGKLQRKDFGTDLQGAVDLYAELKNIHRGVTLRCKNMGFPPPDRLADREVVIVRKNGKRYRGKKLIEPRRYHTVLGELNRRGIWWCPYCLQLRRFVKRKGVRLEEQWMSTPALRCPICGINAQDFHVRRYNPVALILEMSNGQVKDPNRAAKRKRRRAERES